MRLGRKSTAKTPPNGADRPEFSLTSRITPASEGDSAGEGRGASPAPAMVMNHEPSPAVIELDARRRLVERRERWRLKRAAEGLLRNTPVEHCHRSVTGAAVRIMERDGRVFYHDIAKCKSKWACPLCAASAVERNQQELRDALSINKARGGETYLLTFTIRHDREMKVKDAVAGLLKAQSRMKAWRAYKAIMAAAGALGSIASREITFGSNGPHPHVHMLVLGVPGMLGTLEAVRPLWSKAVRGVGLEDVNEHGFDVRGGDYAAEYVAKFGREPGDPSKRINNAWWSAADEMTKGHTKSTKRLGGATPFALLRRYADGDAQAGAQFVEYYDATRRRAMLFWSKGLRKRLDLFRLERPKVPQPRSREVVAICFSDWHAVMRHNARWEVLYVAERYGIEAVAELLHRMRRSRGRWRGDFKTASYMDGRWLEGYWNPADMPPPLKEVA